MSPGVGWPFSRGKEAFFFIKGFTTCQVMHLFLCHTKYCGNLITLLIPTLYPFLYPSHFPKSFLCLPVLGRVIYPIRHLWVQPHVSHVIKCDANRSLKKSLQHFHLLFYSSRLAHWACPHGEDTEQKSKATYPCCSQHFCPADRAGNPQNWRKPNQDQQGCQPTCHQLQMHEWAQLRLEKLPSWPTETYCFKPLNFGLVCYTTSLWQ